VPFGNEFVITFRVVAETTSDKETVCVWTGLLLSLTDATKLKVPVPVVVPERMPAEDKVMPAGSEPELRDHLYGVVPPVAAKVVENAAPLVAEGIEVDVIWRAGAAGAMTVMLSGLLAVWAGFSESLTEVVNEYVPLAVGVPEIVPLGGESERPGGSDPETTDQ
jgi:hypothetical protein